MRFKSNAPIGHPLRAAAYIRVSSEEQTEGYSLDAQQRAIKAYCEAQGWRLVTEYRDEGLSARTDDLAKRPAFRNMLEDAEVRLFDVAIVHKLDRFARNLKVTLESLDRLNAANVAFVSISESMDFSTPIGKVILATLAAFAEYYSDNLSAETKKGKAERKRQGLYNGLLPFGIKKGKDGVPVPDPDTYPGLLLAFKAAAEGKPDRDVAGILNASGYRSTGNRGANPFRKDSVRRILTNWFYLGELPDADGGWIPGQHHSVIDEELFEAAAQARARNRRSIPSKSVKSTASTYSLSGIGTCVKCGGPIHVRMARSGKPRAYCYYRRQGNECDHRSTFLEVYEEQIKAYLDTFTIPQNYREQIMDLYRQAHGERDDAEARRRTLENRIERITELYTWGDIERGAYRQERDQLTSELAALEPVADMTIVLEQTAAFLGNVTEAWKAAGQEQRNQLARLLFEQIEINDDRVEAVIPQPEFAPFFILDCQGRGLSCGSDGLSSRIIPQWYPVTAEEKPRASVRYAMPITHIPQSEWPVIWRRRDAGESLRTIARDFAVSHEAIRGIAAKPRSAKNAETVS